MTQATRDGAGSRRDRAVLGGLVLESDVDLCQDRPAPGSRATDVHVRVADPCRTAMPLPAGEVLLDAADDDGPAYVVLRDRSGRHVLRFHGLCDVTVSADLTGAVVRPLAGAPDGIAQVLASGALVALQLYLRGALVLHAGAVDLGGVAAAVVGHSGMGKSTVAALLCAGGGRLVTDDVLRVDDEDTRPLARLGSTELRLRPDARRVVAAFHRPPGSRTSADGRHVLRLPDDAQDRLPLGAVVIPRPSREVAALAVERVPPKDALLTLLGFPRLVGWRDPGVVRRQFEATAALVDRVPTLEVTVPWGPPFPPELPRELVAALRPYLDGVTGAVVPS